MPPLSSVKRHSILPRLTNDEGYPSPGCAWAELKGLTRGGSRGGALGARALAKPQKFVSSFFNRLEALRASMDQHVMTWLGVYIQSELLPRPSVSQRIICNTPCTEEACATEEARRMQRRSAV